MNKNLMIRYRGIIELIHIYIVIILLLCYNNFA
nr:MAG TPA: hypothetical protein [Caudoviricetes sp.]